MQHARWAIRVLLGRLKGPECVYAALIPPCSWLRLLGATSQETRKQVSDRENQWRCAVLLHAPYQPHSYCESFLFTIPERRAGSPIAPTACLLTPCAFMLQGGQQAGVALDASAHPPRWDCQPYLLPISVLAP
ncbi:hypothetical protein LY78DRAFT_656100 [Colletotrichum sublineola]|nr:hypothetical protein LY78DRAFT_656100 [Colletotrichum sublineola]